MLNTTNLLLLVGQNEIGDFSPRKATIYKTNGGKIICSSWPFSSVITLAKINKKRVILLENTNLHVYATEDMSEIHNIDIGTDISANHICLSPSSDKNNFLIYSKSDDEGIIKVYDLLYLTYKTSIQAHKTKIEKMNINSHGNLMVTTSIKGSIIRVFSLPKGEKLFSFKRGLTYASIYSICFDMDTNTKIVLSSDTGTIHIIDIEANQNDTPSTNEGGIYGFMSNLKSKIISKDYEEMMNYKRPCISMNFNEIKNKNIISFKGGSNGKKVFAVSEKGMYYLYEVNYQSATMIQILEQDLCCLKLVE